jgi:NAD(P)H-flavin reductase
MSGSAFRKRSSAIESFLVSNGVTYTCCALYFFLNICLFGFAAKEEYQRHRDVQRITTTIARGCGAMLNLNLATVLLLASRSFVSFLRDTPLSLLVSLDGLMPGLHALIGSFILFSGTVHSLMHWATYIVKNPWSGGFGGATFLFASGIVLWIIIVVIRVCAWDTVRRKHHEVFRRCHVGGSVVLYIVLCMHGIHRGVPSSWKWIAMPVFLYIGDSLHRMMKEKRSYLLINKHAALFQGQSVLRLRLPQVFYYQPGQYAELKVPQISKTQWHPFTIASAPHEAEMVFYVKAAGNWTTQLFQLFADRFRDERAEDVEVHVRGPFGAPAQHVNQFDHLVLIGGGVGATPFCSIVKSLDNYIIHWQRSEDIEEGKSHEGTRRVLFQRNALADLKRTTKRPNLKNGNRAGLSAFRGTRSTDSAPISSASFHTVPVMRSIDGIETVSIRLSNDGFQSKRSVPQSVEMKLPSPQASLRSDQLAASIREDVNVLLQTQASRNRNECIGWSHVSHGQSQASRSSYWQAVNSLYGDISVQQTCKESFDMLVGMSLGTPSLVNQLQRRRLQQRVYESNSKSATLSALEQNEVDLGVFRDKSFLFLVYMKSVTANLFLLWVLVSRALIAGVAKMFGAVSLKTNGFAIYSSPVLLSIDTLLASVVALGVAAPALVEAYMLGPGSSVCWFDLFVVTPCVVFGVVANILAFANVATSVEYAAVVVMFVVWPLTALLFLLRLIRVVGERMTLGEFKLRPGLGGTRSIDFHWTTPTVEDDSWLVEELCGEPRSSRTKLYRYITRQQKEDAEAISHDRPICQQEVEYTEYCRPKWKEILNEVAERSKNSSRVGVFLCGPESMAEQVHDAVQDAVRNSIIRGLQGSSHIVRSLEEVFGSELTANEHSGDTLEKGGPEERLGCNIRMVFHKERFS